MRACRTDSGEVADDISDMEVDIPHHQRNAEASSSRQPSGFSSSRQTSGRQGLSSAASHGQVPARGNVGTPIRSSLPCGTILLPDHALAGGRTSSTWFPLTENLLEIDELDDDDSDDAPVTPTPTQPRSDSGSPVPKQERAIKPADLLSAILRLKAAGLVEASFRQGILRLYLKPRPSDANELLPRSLRKDFSLALSEVRLCPKEWAGVPRDTDPSGVPMPVRMLLQDEENQNLQQIYEGLDSPYQEWTDYYHWSQMSDQTRALIRRILTERIPGLLTTPFRYQKASIARMVAMEQAPQICDMPSYLRRSTIDGNQSYYFNADGDVRISPPRYTNPKGGILAERMGYGKSLEMLTLVIATLNTLPDIGNVSRYSVDAAKDVPFHPAVGLTPIAVNFPFPGPQEDRIAALPALPLRLPGVVATPREEREWSEAVAARTMQEALIKHRRLPSLLDMAMSVTRLSSGHFSHRDDAQRQLEANPHAYRIFAKLDEGRQTALLDRLCNNHPFYRVHPYRDVAQRARVGNFGDREVDKIYLSSATLGILPADLIDQWEAEISRHVDSTFDFRLLVVKESELALSPSQIASYSLVLTSTHFAWATSEFLCVHWRRVFVDEVSILGNENNLTTDFLPKVRCDSRWAISGTPTSHLGSTLDGQDSYDFDHRKDSVDLGTIAHRFLRHPDFSNPADCRRATMTSLEPVRNILQYVVVRNQQSIIDADHLLPPLHFTIKHVDLSAQEAKLYNALVALQHSHAIQTKRSGPDYIFHPTQSRYLKEVIVNLGVASFFFSSDENVEWVGDGLAAMSQYQESGALSNSDANAAHLVQEKLKEALDDQYWLQSAESVDITIAVRGLPRVIRKLVGARRSPLSWDSSTFLVPIGILIAIINEVERLRTPCLSQWSSEPEFSDELKNAVERFIEERRLTTQEKKGKPKPKDSKRTFPPSTQRAQTNWEGLRALPANSPIASVVMGLTSSTKLNFVIAELRRYPNDKFVIFASTLVDLEFAKMKVAFDLLCIPYLLYNPVEPANRGFTASKFNTTSAAECQAILVDARKGGRGLNLSAASRVILLEPNSDQALEAQSIKRAHRLGQTKEVYVTELVARGTFEDTMQAHRRRLTPQDGTRATTPQDNTHLRQVLESLTYIDSTIPSDYSESLAAEDWKPLIRGERRGAFYGDARRVQTWVEDDDDNDNEGGAMEVEEEGGGGMEGDHDGPDWMSPRKKVKMAVRFA